MVEPGTNSDNMVFTPKCSEKIRSIICQKSAKIRNRKCPKIAHKGQNFSPMIKISAFNGILRVF
jgi:hypothetical protein